MEKSLLNFIFIIWFWGKLGPLVHGHLALTEIYGYSRLLESNGINVCFCKLSNQIYHIFLEALNYLAMKLNMVNNLELYTIVNNPKML